MKGVLMKLKFIANYNSQFYRDIFSTKDRIQNKQDLLHLIYNKIKYKKTQNNQTFSFEKTDKEISDFNNIYDYINILTKTGGEIALDREILKHKSILIEMVKHPGIDFSSISLLQALGINEESLGINP